MSSIIRKKLEGKKTKLNMPKESIKDHPAAINNYTDGSFYQIDIDLIQPDPNQHRQLFDPESLTELSNSIKQKGILQPVIIRKDDQEKIWLVAGERRYRASKMAGLSKIPAVLTTGNPAEIGLIENLQRENLKPIEEAEALNKMINEYNYTQEQLTAVIGKAQSTVSEILSLNKLPKEIKNKLKQEYRRADIPRRLLLEISKQKTHKKMITLFKKIKENALKSDQVRKITRKNSKRMLRAPETIALNKTLSLSNYLPKIDLNNVEENKKIRLIKELQNLRVIISEIVD